MATGRAWAQWGVARAVTGKRAWSAGAALIPLHTHHALGLMRRNAYRSRSTGRPG